MTASALLYVILMCNAGGACAPANPSTFSSPQVCLSELPKLCYGTLQKNGKFYVRDQSKDSWLECIGVNPDDGRIKTCFIASFSKHVLEMYGSQCNPASVEIAKSSQAK